LYGSQKDATLTNHYRLGIGAGNERGLLNEIQTDYGYAGLRVFGRNAGEQFYQIDDLLNNVNRLSIGQYNNGSRVPQSDGDQRGRDGRGGAERIDQRGTAGGDRIGRRERKFGGDDQRRGERTVQWELTGGRSFDPCRIGDGKEPGRCGDRLRLQAGATASQKESLIYNDWNGSSQWYMVKNTTMTGR